MCVELGLGLRDRRAHPAADHARDGAGARDARGRRRARRLRARVGLVDLDRRRAGRLAGLTDPAGRARQTRGWSARGRSYGSPVAERYGARSMSESGATDPADLGLLEAAALLRARALSAVELLEACQARIAARNGGPPTFDGAPGAINAWTRLYPELAARAGAGGRRAAGHRGRCRAADVRDPLRAQGSLRRRRSRPDGVEPRARGQRRRRRQRGVAAPARPRRGPRRAQPHPRVRRGRDHRPGRATRGPPTARPAGRAAARRRRWPRAWSRRRWARTPPARCGSRPRCRASARSSRPTGASPTTAASP